MANAAAREFEEADREAEALSGMTQKLNRSIRTGEEEKEEYEKLKILAHLPHPFRCEGASKIKSRIKNGRRSNFVTSMQSDG